MEEALHKDSQAHAVIRASGKRQGWGLSGIRDRSRDGRSGLSGQAATPIPASVTYAGKPPALPFP